MAKIGLQAFLLNHIHGPEQTDEAAHMARLDLNRALSQFHQTIQEDLRD